MRILAAWLVISCSQGDKPLPPSDPVSVTTPRSAAKRGGVSRALFADDVPKATLPLSISIETLGGVATPILPRGTPLPTEHREVFSTAQDSQPSVEVHILQGERPLARDNRSLGKFQLFGIPPAPRGVPQIEVTFAVDADGVLTVGARDKATGATREIRIEGAPGGALGNAEIDKMLAEANAARADDDQRARWLQARNDLEGLVYSGRKILKETSAKLPAKLRKRCETELRQAEGVLAISGEPGNPSVLVAAKDSLQKAMYDAAEELYRTAK
jgi:molecular chaperone DnaK